MIRAPNLATAVADVVAGAALAGASVSSAGVVIPALGSAALYAGGVALNDAFDVEKDRRLHPERVLPSGRLSVGAARAAGFVLLALGIASGAVHGLPGVAIAATLALAILIYDLLPDGAAFAGVAAIATCRGLNLLRGAVAVPDALERVLPFAIAHALLVAVVTIISLGEDRRSPRAVGIAVRVLPFLYAAPVIAAFQREESLLSLAILVVAAELALWVVRPAFRAAPAPDLVVPRAVFTITLVGALYCAASRSFAAAGVLVALFVASRVAARALAQRGS